MDMYKKPALVSYFLSSVIKLLGWLTLRAGYPDRFDQNVNKFDRVGEPCPHLSEFSAPLCECQGRRDIEESFGEPGVQSVSGIGGAVMERGVLGGWYFVRTVGATVTAAVIRRYIRYHRREGTT